MKIVIIMFDIPLCTDVEFESTLDDIFETLDSLVLVFDVFWIPRAEDLADIPCECVLTTHM